MDKMISDAPTLMLWSTRDPYTGYGPLYDVSAKLFPNSKVVAIQGATHHGILWDHAEETSEAVASFLFERVAQKVSLMSQLKPEDKRKAVAWIFSVIVIVAGFMMELCVSRWLVTTKCPHKLVRLAWTSAKLSFPLLVAASVLSKDLIGAPLFVLGMWKFGFPEVATFVSWMWWQGQPVRYRMANGIVGLGMALHHCSSAVMYAFVVFEIVELDRGLLFTGIAMVSAHWNKLFGNSKSNQ